MNYKQLVMNYRQLIDKEQKDLKSRHKLEQDGRVRDRIKAVLMYNEGYSLQEIASVFYC
jgi:hypothetical protein